MFDETFQEQKSHSIKLFGAGMPMGTLFLKGLKR